MIKGLSLLLNETLRVMIRSRKGYRSDVKERDSWRLDRAVPICPIAFKCRDTVATPLYEDQSLPVL